MLILLKIIILQKFENIYKYLSRTLKLKINLIMTKKQKKLDKIVKI